MPDEAQQLGAAWYRLDSILGQAPHDHCHLGTGGHAEPCAALGPTGESCALTIVATDEGLAAQVDGRRPAHAGGRGAQPDRAPQRGSPLRCRRRCERVWLALALVEAGTLRRRLRTAGGRVPLDDL